MDNTYQGYRPDSAPTAPFTPFAPGTPYDTKRRGTRRGRLVTGTVLASVLTGGAAFAAVTMAGGAPAASPTGQAGSTEQASPTGQGPTGQAALLNEALAAANSPATADGGTIPAGTAPANATPAGTSSGSTPADRDHRARGALARLRLLGGIDGQFTFETRNGPRTIAFERGTVQSATSGDVVVRATDGTTWTWEIVSDSVVRDKGRKTTVGALSPGQLVFVGGPVANGARDARLIVIRTAAETSDS